MFFEKIENNRFIATLIGYRILEEDVANLNYALMDDVEMHDNAEGFAEAVFQETG